MYGIDPDRITSQNVQTTETLKRLTHQVTSGIALLRPGLRRTFLIALVFFLFSSVAIVFTFFDRFYVVVPAQGGKIVEGIIDRPRFINPVLARTGADRSLTALVYSGLMRMNPDGTIVPDLAESVSISDDGLIYTFTLKENLRWHDGEPVTADDFLYTIEKIKDPSLEIKSLRRAAWEGVDVSSPDPHTIVITLKQPYAPLLENATVGILPKHIWKEITDNEFDVSYYNLDPIGTGPYRIARIVQDDKKGLPLSYELDAFPGYALGEPYISSLSIRFFGNNKDLLQAYQDRVITQFPTVDPEVAQEIESAGGRITRMHLPLVDAAFFNQNEQPLFVDKTLRQALAAAVDKDRIVRTVLYGYGARADGPIGPLDPQAPILQATATNTGPGTAFTGTQDAMAILLEEGWAFDEEKGVLTKKDKKSKKVSTLEFSITVPDVPELRKVADILKENWDALGARTTIKTFETGTFGSAVLAPRKYDVLVYGIIGKVSDPYPYWHSSQRNAPGANIANYTNRTADDLLEKIRKESNVSTRADLLGKLEDEIIADTPAVFLYSPDFLYATDPRVHGVESGHVLVESDRFNGIANWYTESDRVWSFLEPLARRTPQSESRLSLALWKYF